MALSLGTVQALSPNRVRATFAGGTPFPVTIARPAQWLCAPIGAPPLGEPVEVTRVELEASGVSALVSLAPALSPGRTYALQATDAADEGGHAAPDAQAFVALETATAPDRPELVEALLHAALEEVAETGGEPCTLLTHDFVDGLDTALRVESTLRFPASGAVWVGNQRFTYSSRTDQTLAGLVRTDGPPEGIPTATEVVADKLSSPAQLEQVLRDTLVTHADGDLFDRLARFLGFPRPGVIRQEAWRAALRAVAFGPRGTPGCLQAALEGAFSDMVVQLLVTADPASNYVLSAPGLCDPAYGGRLVRLALTPATTGVAESLLFYIVEATADELRLCPQRTAYWRGANWLVLDAPQTTTATILPFHVRETTPGLDDVWGDAAVVDVILAEALATAPPTYLLSPDGEDRDVAASGSPFGGALMDLYDADPDAHDGDATQGPHPIYLNDLDAGGFDVEPVLSGTLAAGCRVRFRTAA